VFPLNELARAKARYRKAADNARRQTVRNLSAVLGEGFTIGGWGSRAWEAYRDQWSGGGWDWEKIFGQYDEPGRLEIVLWTGDRLCGLGLATITNQAVVVEFIQGNPVSDCPFLGSRALICLEAAACYAQAIGRAELRLYPKNEELEALFRDTYGFTIEKPPNARAYYRKGV
jgi:hypothetical protein